MAGAIDESSNRIESGVVDPVFADIPSGDLRLATATAAKLAAFRTPEVDLALAFDALDDLSSLLSKGDEVPKLLGRWGIVRRDLIPLACRFYCSDHPDSDRAVIEITRAVSQLARTNDQLLIAQAFSAERCDSSVVSCAPLEPFVATFSKRIEKRIEALATPEGELERIDSELVFVSEMIEGILAACRPSFTGSGTTDKTEIKSRLVTSLDKVDFYQCLALLFSTTEAADAALPPLVLSALEILHLTLCDLTPTQLVALIECGSDGLESSLQSRRRSSLKKLLRTDEETSARVDSRPTSLARWGTRFRGLYVQGADTDEKKLSSGLEFAAPKAMLQARSRKENFEKMMTAMKGRRNRTRTRTFPKKRPHTLPPIGPVDAEAIDGAVVVARAVAEAALGTPTVSAPSRPETELFSRVESNLTGA